MPSQMLHQSSRCRSRFVGSYSGVKGIETISAITPSKHTKDPFHSRLVSRASSIVSRFRPSIEVMSMRTSVERVSSRVTSRHAKGRMDVAPAPKHRGSSFVSRFVVNRFETSRFARSSSIAIGSSRFVSRFVRGSSIENQRQGEE